MSTMQTTVLIGAIFLARGTESQGAAGMGMWILICCGMYKLFEVLA